MLSLVSVAILGVIGVLCRYGVDAVWGNGNQDFPTSTLIVNTLGCFAAGTIYVLGTYKNLSPILQTGLLVGFCGGFTTFSAYTLQTITLLERGKALPAFTYLVISPPIGLLAAFVPIFLFRKVYS